MKTFGFFILYTIIINVIYVLISLVAVLIMSFIGMLPIISGLLAYRHDTPESFGLTFAALFTYIIVIYIFKNKFTSVHSKKGLFAAGIAGLILCTWSLISGFIHPDYETNMWGLFCQIIMYFAIIYNAKTTDIKV